MSPSVSSFAESGFSLLQLSIVLVIIGLVVGGTITGADLIKSAATRSQVAQIEKYYSAVATFRNQYGFLPGDLREPFATNAGFQARGPYAGQGDGNSIVEGNCANTSVGNSGTNTGCGETAVFWQDISTAKLIDYTIYGYDTKGANYPANVHDNGSGVTLTTTPTIREWLPAAKVGGETFLYIFSSAGTNYFGLSTITKIGWNAESTSNPGVSVMQAYNIDAKIDDGLPQLGNVRACYLNYNVVNGQVIWAKGGLTQGTGGASCTAATTATAYATTNCYDNSNVAGVQKYSTAQNGNRLNCALSFAF